MNWGDASVRESTWSLIVPEPNSGCWLWTGRTNKGYGVRSSEYVHRSLYEANHGTIGDGLEIDHLCRNTACCNPAHLEPVTRAENQRRRAATITHCPSGHPYSESNTYRWKNSRYCRVCLKAHDKARKEKR